MAAASIRYLSDLPDPVVEIDKCRDFLTNFRDELGQLKYINILVLARSLFLYVFVPLQLNFLIIYALIIN
jgi:hypothetical protein